MKVEEVKESYKSKQTSICDYGYLDLQSHVEQEQHPPLLGLLGLLRQVVGLPGQQGLRLSGAQDCRAKVWLVRFYCVFVHSLKSKVIHLILGENFLWPKCITLKGRGVTYLGLRPEKKTFFTPSLMENSWFSGEQFVLRSGSKPRTNNSTSKLAMTSPRWRFFFITTVSIVYKL